MRVVETYAEDGYKVTIFKTDLRYLIQLEDERYMLSWKLPIETDYAHLKQSITDKLVPMGKEIWPDLNRKLNISTSTTNEEDFPQII
ncbi:MAG: hypothetical protein GVX96_01335 [Bacteroidetes bacterium]|jgi:hypothetical protein|nr:hypothetical protein [Bacteroidota bacterium]